MTTMSHVYGKGYYTSSTSSTKSQQQQQQSSFSFQSSGDDFEYDSSVLTSPGNKRSLSESGTCGKRLRLSDNQPCNSFDDDRGINGNEHTNYSMNGNNYFSSKNPSYHTAAGNRNNFPQRQTNGYNSSHGRNEDVSNFDQRQSYNHGHIEDCQYDSKSPRLFLGQPQFEGNPRHHKIQQHQGPSWENGMTNSFRKQQSNNFSGSDGPPYQRDFNPRFQNEDHFQSGPRTFDNPRRSDNTSRVSGASSVSPPKAGIVTGSLNYPEYSNFYLIKSA